MQMVQVVRSGKDKNNRNRTWGLFICPHCNQQVEMRADTGLRSSSCGCRKGRFVHGFSSASERHPLYWVWKGMVERCTKPENKNYKRYGGRGIKVCDEWLDAQTFIQWGLSHGWQSGLQIDRTNNDGGYEPANCRFVTAAVNVRNRSTTKQTLRREA